MLRSTLASLLFVQLLRCCLASPSLGKSSPPAAHVFGPQRTLQHFLQQQQQVLEDDEDDWVVDVEEEEKAWADWDQAKYVVKDPFDEAFDSLVEETMEHWHVPGLSVAVVHGDDTFAKGYGKATLAPPTNATPDTLYYVGSTTKSFTAASILLLIEDSRRNGSNLPRLELTTPVSSIIRDEFVLPSTYATEKATLEDLMTHRTGMPRHETSYGNDTLRGYVENLRNLPLTADLRTTYQYCNLMYTTLAYILEKLTSSTWGEFVHSRIWTPLSMANTFASITAARTTAPHLLSAPYCWDEASGRHVREPYLASPVLTGAGSVVSSVADYAKYLRALLKRRPNFFGGPYGLRELRRAGRIVVSNDEDYAPWAGPPLYGLAWERQAYGSGLEVWSHGGSVTGYGAWMAYAPKAGWGVAIMANTELWSNMAADVVFYALLDELVGTPAGERKDWVKHHDKLIEEVKAKRARAREILYPGAPREEGVPLSLPLGRYAGTYRNAGYGELSFEVDEGHWASPFGNASSSADGGEGEEEGEVHARQHLHAKVADKVWQFELCLEHVSGEYFIAWQSPTPEFPNSLFKYEMPVKAVFVVDVSGKVSHLLVAAEPKMEEGMIVFERVA